MLGIAKHRCPPKNKPLACFLNGFHSSQRDNKQNFPTRLRKMDIVIKKVQGGMFGSFWIGCGIDEQRNGRMDDGKYDLKNTKWRYIIQIRHIKRRAIFSVMLFGGL